jgi:hypothetical protein
MIKIHLPQASRPVVLLALFACTSLACNVTEDEKASVPTSSGRTGINDARKKTAGADRASVEPGRLPVGPYKFIQLTSGEKAPWYLLPFDKIGVCEAPLTRDSLVQTMKTQNYTDVFIFSHGWNNDWDDANHLYEGWINGFIQLRRDKGLELGREFHPLFIGIIWPSTALVLPSEQGPGFRSAASDDDAFVGQERAEVHSLAESVPDAERARFYQLTQRPQGTGLNEADALALAKILARLYKAPDKEAGEDPALPAPEDLLNAWKKVGEEPQKELGNFRVDLSKFDPRWIVRVATVWQMKDRAGTVGQSGVGPLLDEILGATPPAGQFQPRVHLLGHSYGAKVVLSALCAKPMKPRRVNSVLLLEPAISYLCFSPNAAGAGKPGGYVDAPNRCEQPILSTYSSCDAPLTKFFHLALRRTSDLGERAANTPPSIYAALGGFGPAVDPGISSVKLLDYPNKYPLDDGSRKVIGINATPPNGDCKDPAGIDAHGDVSNVHTYWMLFNQLIQPLPGAPTP